VFEFMAGHTELLDDQGPQRVVRVLPEIIQGVELKGGIKQHQNAA
jgi:hypothetical protein